MQRQRKYPKGTRSRSPVETLYLWSGPPLHSPTCHGATPRLAQVASTTSSATACPASGPRRLLRSGLRFELPVFARFLVAERSGRTSLHWVCCVRRGPLVVAIPAARKPYCKKNRIAWQSDRFRLGASDEKEASDQAASRRRMWMRPRTTTTAWPWTWTGARALLETAVATPRHVMMHMRRIASSPPSAFPRCRHAIPPPRPPNHNAIGTR